LMALLHSKNTGFPGVRLSI